MDLSVLTSPAEFGVFRGSEAAVDRLEDFYRRFGFVILRDLFPVDLVDRMETECAAAQNGVLAGTVPERYGSTQYLDDETKIEKFVNYVEHVEEIAPAVREAATYPELVTVIRRFIGENCWLSDENRIGVVYQDARPGKESGYTRIGWHSDWQASPSLDIWPSVAFTFHLDGTSPANGFLRVVPGSHRWATPAPYRNVNNVTVPDEARSTGGYTDTPPPFPMALGFEKIPGEIPVYTERGDIILHDAYLWHSAARATDDAAVRRHVRSGYFNGDREKYANRYQFLKNAAR